MVLQVRKRADGKIELSAAGQVIVITKEQARTLADALTVAAR